MNKIIFALLIYASCAANAQSEFAFTGPSGTTAAPQEPSGLPEGALHPDAKSNNPVHSKPVWKPFIAAFNKCANQVFDGMGCQPVGYDTGGPMCHATGAAIDVFGIKCKPPGGQWKYYWAGEDTGFGGSPYKGQTIGAPFQQNKNWRYPNYNPADAKSDGKSDKISKMIECMAGPRNQYGYNTSKMKETKIGCIWHRCSLGRTDSTACHRDHMHCGIGCNLGGARGL